MPSVITPLKCQKMQCEVNFLRRLFMSLLLQINMSVFTFVKLMMTLVNLLIFVSMFPRQFHAYIELQGAVKVLIFTDSVSLDMRK